MIAISNKLSHHLLITLKFYPEGAVGTPFPGVEVAIGKANAYTKSGYDIITQGNSRKTKVLPGG